MAKGPKAAKGLINLCGYWVNTDPNDSVLVRLKRLAEKMGRLNYCITFSFYFHLCGYLSFSLFFLYLSHILFFSSCVFFSPRLFFPSLSE